MMTRYQAYAESSQRWCRGNAYGSAGNRIALTRIRRKSVDLRFEVGFWQHGKVNVLGRGRTWEEAFANADRGVSP